MKLLYCKIYLFLLLCRLELSISVQTGANNSQVNNIQLITVNLELNYNTTDIIYSYDEDNEAHIFKAREHRLIEKVTQDGQVVWTASNNKYPDAVIIQPDDNNEANVRLHYPEPSTTTSVTPTAKSQKSEPELVEVNIKVKESTQHIRYRKDEKNDREFFTAKKGFLISKIVKNGDLIHESTNKEYFDRVVIYRDEKNERRVKFLQPGKIDLDFMVLIDLDVKVKENTDYYFYKKDNSTDREKFKCRFGYLINKVISGSTLVSEAKDNKYFDRVIIYKDENNEKKVRVLFPGDVDNDDPNDEGLDEDEDEQVDLSSDSSSKPKSIEVAAKSGPPVTPPGKSLEVAARSGGTARTSGQPTPVISASTSAEGKTVSTGGIKSPLQLFIKDPKDNSKSIELEASKFKTKEWNLLRLFSYNFDQNDKCVKVILENYLVWKHDGKSSSYPLAVSWHEKYALVFLKFGDDQYNFYRMASGSDQWKLIHLQNVNHLKQNKIKLYQREGTKLKEMNSLNYSLMDLGFAYEYVFKEGVRCEEFKYDKDSMYLYNPIHNDEYPFVIYLYSTESAHLIFKKGSSYAFPSVPKKKSWWQCG